jgi:5'-3' exonuclease
MTYCLVDADSILYKVGFACENTFYSVQGREFQYKKEAVKHCKDNSIAISEIIKDSSPEPVEMFLDTLRRSVLSILSACAATDWEVHLTAGKCYRFQVCTEYKATRKTEKPRYYKEMVSYLDRAFDAIINTEIEADDAVCIRAHELGVDNCVVAHIDKDLDQIPGTHYNYHKAEMYTVAEEEAMYNLYSQFLIGDTSDNIKGVHGIGKAKAKKILSQCKTDKEYQETIVREYIKEGTPFITDNVITSWAITASDKYLKNNKLLRLLTTKEQATGITQEYFTDATI